jgi:ornithine carbamoyltransferase
MNLLSVNGLGKADVEKIFALSAAIEKDSFFPKPACAGLVFDRPSTRTRVSFEVALREIGFHPIYLDYVFSQLSRGEKIEDTGRVLGSYVKLIIARLHKHDMLERLAESSTVPVINAATDLEHPCQALGDLFTLKQAGLLKSGLKIAFIGNPSTNVANSMAAICGMMGVSLSFISPKGYLPNPAYAKGCKVSHAFDMKADIAYTGPFDAPEESVRDFLPYMLDSQKMSQLGAKYSMHPLPAVRGVEVSDDVLDSKQSLAWLQAANKVAVQKGIIQYLLGDK